MRAYHSLTSEETLTMLGSGELGIPQEEAEKRLRAFGENALRGKKKGGALRLFFAQFKDFMTILLICAAVVSAVIGSDSYETGLPWEQSAQAAGA